MYSVLHRCSAREAPPHEGLLCWAEIFSLLLVDEDGPLKWPRSRWTGIPQNLVHRQYPPAAWPVNAPSGGGEGSEAPRSYWALQRHASTHAVRGPCEDAEAVNTWHGLGW
jgi:hypothetical protein